MKYLSGAAKIGAAKILRKAAAWAILAGCGFALVRCEDRMAGSSVTTGNPTEIQVGFTGENGPVAISGRVELYGATQIPVPGFRPKPLAQFDLDGKQEFRLNGGHFDGIADSLWPPGSKVGDSLVRFNLVIAGDKQGAIIRDLTFRLKAANFALKDGAWTAGKAGEAAQIKVGITTLIPFRASLDPTTLNKMKHHYLFLAGTGFYAQENTGKFEFPGLPDGVHRPSFFSVPTKELQASAPQDSIDVYSLDRPLSSEGPNLSEAGPIQGAVSVPKDLP